jgi:hypothetical protein
MKADQSDLDSSKLPVKSRTVLTHARRKLELVRTLVAATLRRLFETGERLRATLGDDPNEI